MLTKFVNISKACWIRKDGIAAVEFALMLPILLLFIATVFDIGRLMFDYQAVNKSTRDSVRYLTRVNGGATGLNMNCGTGLVDATSAEAVNAMRLAMTGYFNGDASLDPVVKTWTDDSNLASAGISITVTCYDNTGTGGAEIYDGFFIGDNLIESINFTADVPFRLALLSAFGIGPTFNFEITHRMVHIGN